MLGLPVFIIISLLAINAYGVVAVTLDTNMLTQLGYNNESVYIYVRNNVDDIDPDAFKGYTNAISLYLGENALTKVDLSLFKDMVSLGHLLLLGNPLTQFTNSKNIKFPSLLVLDLSDCPLNGTSFDSNVTNALPNLLHLYVILRNPLKTNQLSPLKNLQYLTIATKNQTSLTKDHFNGLNSIISLSFTDSNIKTIEVHSLLALPNAIYILLQNNALTSFEYLQIPPNVYTLDLSGNKMNYFMLSITMGVIRKFKINNNLFRSFKSMNFSFLANLTELDLSNNPHAYPNEIAGHLKPLVNLEIVDISNLSINSTDSNFFKQNTKLTSISLSNNKISVLPYNIFSHLKSLVALYLTFNQISVLDNRTFVGLENFCYLSLGFNKLTKINGAFYNLSTLASLDLSNNLISEVDSSSFSGCYNLRSLSLENNQLTKISPKTFENLTLVFLKLGSNQITELDNSTFAGINSLDYLEIHVNKISRIESGTFKNLKLKLISLYFNQLTKIENDTFAGQDQLYEINLSSNKLSTFEEGTFSGLTNLQTIHLEGNNFTQLDNSTFAGCNNLQEIFLYNNPNLIKSNLQSLCPTTAANCNVYFN